MSKKYFWIAMAVLMAAYVSIIVLAHINKGFVWLLIPIIFSVVPLGKWAAKKDHEDD